MRDDVEETSFSIHDDLPAAARRRAEPRLLTLLRVGTVVIDDRRELCLIRNISSAGMMLHLYSRVVQGQQIAVEMKTGRTLAGSVQWVDGENVGIRFDAAVDVAAMLAAQMVSHPELKARMPRVEVRAPATLRVGAHSWRVVTGDVSQGGAKIMVDAVLPADAPAVLSMEGFHSLHGVLRWSDGEAAGFAFNAVVPWPQLVRWLKERRDIGPPRQAWRPRRAAR